MALSQRHSRAESDYRLPAPRPPAPICRGTLPAASIGPVSLYSGPSWPRLVLPVAGQDNDYELATIIIMIVLYPPRAELRLRQS